MTSIRELASEQRLQLLIEGATAHAIIVLDLEGRIIQWNSGAERVLGWSAPEVLGEQITLIFTEEDLLAGMHEAELETARREGLAADIRWHVRKGGTRFYADGVVYAMYENDGSLIGFGKILREAHSPFGRQIEEQKYGHSPEYAFMAAVLDAIEDGVVACNAEGVLTLFNRATREFHGLPATSLPSEKWASHYDLYRPDGVTPLKEEEIPLFRALRGEHLHDVEMVISPREGKRRILLASGGPLIDRDGKTFGAVVSMHDITAHREAQLARESALREQARREEIEAAADHVRRSEERFRTLVMASAQIVWTADPAGRAVDDSPTWRVFTGQTYEEYKGFGWADAIHPEDCDRVVGAWLDSTHNRRLFEMEFQLRRSDGEYRLVNARAAAIYNDNGSVREWIGFNTDVTEVRQAEEALRKSQQQAIEEACRAEAERHRLDAVLKAAPVGIIVTDADGAFLETNQETRRLLGDNHPMPRNMDDYREWKAWWADGSEKHGQRVQPHEWPVACVLRGEESLHDTVEFETFGTPPARRLAYVSAAPIKDGAGRITGAVAAVMDITRRINAEASLRDTAARLQLTLNSAKIGEWDLDLVNDTSYRSLLHDQCFGYQEPIADWGFEKFIQHVHPEDRERVRKDFKAAVNGLTDWNFECRVIWPDGSVHWIAAHGRPYGASGKLTRMTGIVFDITERKQAEERVRHASLHDQLTGLPNRAMLFEYGSHVLPHSSRAKQRAAALFLDLDRFKPINDTHGHEVGDAVLKEAAGRLQRAVRAEDLVVRLGGDEFVILLLDIKGASGAAEAARHIIESISQPYHIGELALSISASIGISVFPQDGHDIDALLSHADLAMYQAKQAGRNNYQFYCKEFAAGARLQLAIEQQLKGALSAQSFYLYYQPVLNIETGEIVSVEALLRWNNAEIGPDRFVPVAEATGIINPIGRWLLEQACRQHKAWLSHGLPPIPVAVNVSVVEFRDRNFASRFERVLQEHGLNENALQLELTETAVMDDTAHAVEVLSQLKALGVTILLDDFGTGHSSLAYLSRLPLNKVKIDKSFTSDLERDDVSRTVTNAMIALGRTLNLEVVAEGIESANVLDYIRVHGCKQGQGFYLGRPMPGDAFETWYWKHQKEWKAVQAAAH